MKDTRNILWKIGIIAAIVRQKVLNSFTRFREETGTWERKPGFQALTILRDVLLSLCEERKHKKAQSPAKPLSFQYKSTRQWFLPKSLGKEPAYIDHFKVKPTNHTRKYLAIIIKDTFLTSDFN